MSLGPPPIIASMALPPATCPSIRFRRASSPSFVALEPRGGVSAGAVSLVDMESAPHRRGVLLTVEDVSQPRRAAAQTLPWAGSVRHADAESAERHIIPTARSDRGA